MKEIPIKFGKAPTVHIKQDIVDGIRKALEDLHVTNSTSFHLSFPVGGEGTIGDAHFTIQKK